jgi:hypothetical protein
MKWPVRMADKVRICIAGAAAVLGAGTACVDAPFARVNPNDSDATFTMELVSSRDTLSLENRYAVLRVLTTPAVGAYEVVWTMEPVGTLSHVGNGVFEYVSGPTTDEVTVTAAFRARSATYVLVREGYQ